MKRFVRTIVLVLMITIFASSLYIPAVSADYTLAQRMAMLESKDYLDLLKTIDGDEVLDKYMWEETRRKELYDLMVEYMYGYIPENALKNPTVSTPMTKGVEPARTWPSTATTLAGTAVYKQILVSVAGTTPGKSVDIYLHIYLPKAKVDNGEKVPLILFINNRSSSGASSNFWPVETMINRGYGAAMFYYEDVVKDTRESGKAEYAYNNGAFLAFAQGPTGLKQDLDLWGEVAAWSWGAIRCMDYLETDTDIDPKKVAVLGHSRGGKSALWAAAIDERFAMAISNSSSCGGASIFRGKPRYASLLSISNEAWSWYCRNMREKTYVDATVVTSPPTVLAGEQGLSDKFKVDQHMLLALIAPRLVYIQSSLADKSGESDGATRPEDEYLAAVAVKPAYDIYGLPALGKGTEGYPGASKAILKSEVGDSNKASREAKGISTGYVGYHVREGAHGMEPVDYEMFMDFADKHLANAFTAYEIPGAGGTKLKLLKNPEQPVAIDLKYSAARNQPGTTHTATITEQPTVGTFTTDLDNYKVYYTPPADFLGDVTFKFKVTDNKGRESNEATVTMSFVETLAEPEPPVPLIIQSVEVSEGNTRLVGATVKNDSPTEKTTDLIFAVYDSNWKMKAIAIKKANVIDAGETATINLDTPLALEEDYKHIRVFAWGSDLKPMAGVFDYELRDVLVSNLAVHSTLGTWEAAEEPFGVGSLLYVQGTSTANTIPASLVGGVQIRPDNSKKTLMYNGTFSGVAATITAVKPVTVYLALSQNYDHTAPLPGWMSGWSKSTETPALLDSSGATYTTYYKDFTQTDINGNIIIELGCTLTPAKNPNGTSKTPSPYVIVLKPLD
ncbi:MAG: hypothetical protein BWY15_00321 [Firmicutes bacterium ADurb.Bin193]|nr:MAG: hypothetical protein BWY15_00321 [Firmicutes bacterium ADurb.Bin193]